MSAETGHVTLVREQARRRKLLAEAIHNSALAGMEVSQAFGTDGELYARGEITADELLWRTLVRKKAEQ